MNKNRFPFSLSTVENQIFAILGAAFIALLTGSVIYHVSHHRNVVDEAKSDSAINQIILRVPILERIKPEELQGFIAETSICHKGFTVTRDPYLPHAASPTANDIRDFVAEELSRLKHDRSKDDISIARTEFSRGDFSFAQCGPDEFDYPVDGIVISVRMNTGEWLNVEIHAHKFEFGGHSFFEPIRIYLFFILVGIVALFFIRRFTKPLSNLTQAASKFGNDLQVDEIEENGPADIRHAIRSFNTMQREVRDEMKRRTQMLAAVGHDIRTPLTALRVKAELIQDAKTRDDIVASVAKMERITASALDYVRGESRSEPKQNVDLRALIESECSEFEDLGREVLFRGEEMLHYHCRPIALARAVRNLIDNAVKYGGKTDVELVNAEGYIEIRVLDEGPGIAEAQLTHAFDPFVRLSDARESETGGFGLGLSIAKAIIDGHDGTLRLEANNPNGLRAIIQLPLSG